MGAITHRYVPGRYFSHTEETGWSRGIMSSTYEFTPETKFAISAVPEPQTWLMLGAGMALLGAVKRRRSRNA